MCSFFSDVVFDTEYIDFFEHGEKASTSVVSKPSAMKDDKPNEFVDTMSMAAPLILMPNAIKVDNPNELVDSKAMVTPLISMPGAITAMEVNNNSEKKRIS